MPETTKWMLVTDTLCQGVIPSEWSGDRPVLYNTEAEAQAEAADWHYMRLDALETDEEHEEEEGDEPTDWPIPVLTLPDGTVVALDGSDAVWTPEDLHRLRT